MANPFSKTFSKYAPHDPSQPAPSPGTWLSRILNRKLTHASTRPQTPLVDMQVLVLGLPRTATASIRKAMFRLGYYDVYHMASLFEGALGERELWIRALEAKMLKKGAPLTKGEWYQLLGHCEVATDFPPAAFVPELMAAFPHAKIILSTRSSAEVWYKSMRGTLEYSRKISWFFERGFWSDLYMAVMPVPLQARLVRYILEYSMGPTNEVFDATWEQRYHEHNEMVRRLVREQGRECLEYNVKDGWAPLCEFLGKELVDEPFPQSNDAEEWRGRVMKATAASRAATWAAVKKRAVVGLEIVGAVAVAAVLYRRYLSANR